MVMVVRVRRVRRRVVVVEVEVGRSILGGCIWCFVCMCRLGWIGGLWFGVRKDGLGGRC